MATIQRNQPCPCGSGTKYKKCCFLRAPALPPPAAPATFGDGDPWALEDDELDALSNSVLTLLKARRFDEADAVCLRLLTEYPDVVDGLERSALVAAARGDHVGAAAFYRKAYAFVTDPIRRHEYEEPDYYREQAEQQERRAEADHACPAAVVVAH